MKKIKKLIQLTSFVLLTVLCVSGVMSILLPKNYTGAWMSPVPTFRGFYDLEENTVDVLFLGSSHSYSSFCPQVLYDEYGLTSYNLGMGNQNIVLNYFWLKEALKTQKPKVVVLESVYAFFHEPITVDFMDSANQKSLNYMHWFPNRLGAIRALCEIDPEGYSYGSFVPLFRYHDRWKELHEEDFSLDSIEKRAGRMGFSVAFRYYGGDTDFEPFDISPTDDAASLGVEPEEMEPCMREYLDKIRELCEKEEIRLVLTVSPNSESTIAQYLSLREYADEYGLEYYDFDLASEFAAMNYDFPKDNADEEHPSFWGAQKVTRRMGEYLMNPVGGSGTGAGFTALSPHTDSQWENARIHYQNAQKDAELTHVKDLREYIPMLKDDRYSVLISVRGDASAGMDGETARALMDLGLSEDLRTLDGDAYVAVIDGGEVIVEERDEDSVWDRGSIREGKTFYHVDSSGAPGEYGAWSSIRVDEEERSRDSDGINIVVILRENCACLDSVCFDTTSADRETAVCKR